MKTKLSCFKTNLLPLLFIVFSFCWSPVQTSAARSNFYLEIKKKTIEVGVFSEKKFKKISLASFSRASVNQDSVKKLLEWDQSQSILFYFHAMWGGQQMYHKPSLKKINSIKGLDKIISIIWHTDRIGYKKSWKLAIRQGEEISGLLQHLLSKSDNDNYVLCHSMGHRIFEGVIKNFTPNEPRFQIVFFAASDLDLDVFSKNLQTLPLLSHKITLYCHERDRFLKLARFTHRRDRLGLHAPQYIHSLDSIPRLEIVNVTRAKQGKKFSLSNHMYFKNHKGVLRDIELQINNDSITRSKYLIRKSRNYLELK